MARTPAVLPGGMRLSDYLSIAVITKVFPVRAVQAALRESGRASRRRRALPAEAMVYYVISMGMFRAASAREVLRCLADGLRWTRVGTEVRMASQAAVSLARTRLGTQPLRNLRQFCVRPLAEAGTRGAWYRGLRLLAYDGTTLDVPDERRNRKEFGLSAAGRRGAACPKARVTALVELGTRAGFAWEYGPHRESEKEQAERLHAHLKPGMLLLAGRGHLGAASWQSATRTGADLLWGAKPNSDLPLRRALADGSFLSEFAGAPARVIEYGIVGSEDRHRLLTSRLDPIEAPAVELAALYHERWEIESVCDEIKTHLLGHGPVLRSKTPALVRQEIEGLMLAHFAVRHFLHEAAQEAEEARGPLRFTHDVQVLRRRNRNPGAPPPSAPTADAGAGREDRDS